MFVPVIAVFALAITPFFFRAIAPDPAAVPAIIAATADSV